MCPRAAALAQPGRSSFSPGAAGDSLAVAALLHLLHRLLAVALRDVHAQRTRRDWQSRSEARAGVRDNFGGHALLALLADLLQLLLALLHLLFLDLLVAARADLLARVAAARRLPGGGELLLEAGVAPPLRRRRPFRHRGEERPAARGVGEPFGKGVVRVIVDRARGEGVVLILPAVRVLREVINLTGG